MKPTTRSATTMTTHLCLALLSMASLTCAILVQPHNFAPEEQDSAHQQEAAAALMLDQDLLKFQRLRDARLEAAAAAAAVESAEQEQHFSQEMADLIHREHQHQIEKQQESGQSSAGEKQPSLSASVAHVLMNVARAAQAAQDQAAASAAEDQSPASSGGSSSSESNQQQQQEMSSRGSIMELDTSSASGSSQSAPSKADLKQVGPKQWFNPKETIPVLKISSMATPSKYKKVYFRAEKKLVDGAFHSPSSEKDEKKSLIKSSSSSSSFNSGVQRRSSRGTSSSVPPGILQDGVIDFLKKFRDVYIQTRPASSAAASPSFASSFLASAASSPLATILAPSSGSGSSRPNLASAISAATSMMSSAAQVAQAASASPALSSSSSSSSATGGAAAAAGSAAAASGNSVKAPLTAQSYVSFWSKTFPTWVRKMLKQMRRRSLHNSSKRQQHQHQHQHSASIGQAAASVSVGGDQSSGSSSSGSSSSKQT